MRLLKILRIKRKLLNELKTELEELKEREKEVKEQLEKLHAEIKKLEELKLSKLIEFALKEESKTALRKSLEKHRKEIEKLRAQIEKVKERFLREKGEVRAIELLIEKRKRKSEILKEVLHEREVYSTLYSGSNNDDRQQLF